MITFYKSVYNGADPSLNGGGITEEIAESGVVNSLVPQARAIDCELGRTRWIKFFAKTDIDIVNVGFCIAKPSQSQNEEVYLAFGTKTDYESDIDKVNIRIYGAFAINAIDSSQKLVVADRDVSNFVKANDLVTFFDSFLNRIIALRVAEVDAENIYLQNFTDISNAAYGASVVFLESLAAADYIGLWLKQEIYPHIVSLDSQLNSFVLSAWWEEV